MKCTQCEFDPSEPDDGDGYLGDCLIDPCPMRDAWELAQIHIEDGDEVGVIARRLHKHLKGER